VLTAGPPPARRAPLPARLRAQLAAVLLVLAAGVLAATDRSDPLPPSPQAPAPTFPGVGATARLDDEQELVVRLALRVVVEGRETGRGDTGGPDEPEQLRLVEVRARGFAVRLVERRTPLDLGAVGRFGSGLRSVVPFDADVTVVDCSVEVGAARTVVLSLRRDDGPAGRVPVTSAPEVVRALDDLVRRSCRRPRG
jgi:hypothetical protein